MSRLSLSDVVAAQEAMIERQAAQLERLTQMHAETLAALIDRLWADNAELRDEINAVANRVESLTRAVMADPAEVAQAIVNDANRSTLREVRHEWAFCRECNTHHSFTEGKCDFCSAPIVGVGEKL